MPAEDHKQKVEQIKHLKMFLTQIDFPQDQIQLHQQKIKDISKCLDDYKNLLFEHQVQTVKMNHEAFIESKKTIQSNGLLQKIEDQKKQIEELRKVCSLKLELEKKFQITFNDFQVSQKELLEYKHKHSILEIENNFLKKDLEKTQKELNQLKEKLDLKYEQYEQKITNIYEKLHEEQKKEIDKLTNENKKILEIFYQTKKT
ncbi:hypothetical protein AB837_00588 [bacterium AB1]|nr:hypothetical protein AB837_00588 [bacterium AB1]